MTDTPFRQSEPRAEAPGAPSLAIGRVVLTVHDLGRVADFYERVVGLHRLTQDGSSVELGVGDRVLLELRQDSAARYRSPREAGLFHTAFLLPNRPALGRWLKRAMEERHRLVGASDHSVSEALYLSDPEGNGVEIYTDRPPSAWQWRGGQVEMPSEPLDLGDLLLQAGHGAWEGVPAGTTIGHVHLQVGAIPAAEQFYAGQLGLAVTCRYPGGTFYAADGYHHHIATNVWNSRGAPRRSYPSTGLSEVEIRMAPAALAAVQARSGAQQPDHAGLLSLADPWDTRIAVRSL